jgi:uncharacterized protein
MSLQQNIEKDYIIAFKAKKQTEVSALRMLRSAIKNMVIDKKTSLLKDEDVLSIIKRELKKRQDSMESFKSAGRDDLFVVEEAEAEVLKKYTPAMMSEEELDKIIDNVISEGHSNFGLVMKEVMVKTKGQADGRMIQEKVKKKLNL